MKENISEEVGKLAVKIAKNIVILGVCSGIGMASKTKAQKEVNRLLKRMEKRKAGKKQ